MSAATPPDLPPDTTPELHPDLAPIGWLVGSWTGTGARVWPGTPDTTLVYEVTFAHDGRPFLSYTSRSWEVTADGSRGVPGPAESGWWRRGPGKYDLEVVLSLPEGAVEVLVGTVAFSKIELVSDLVARTVSATTGVTATTRLFGGVEGDLAFVVEQATGEVPLQPYLSARLGPVPA
jgi:hypothetical protein